MSASSQMTRRQALAAAAAAALIPAASSRTQAAPVAETRAGRVRGAERHGGKIFRGVPYGANTGANRWLPPKPVVAWSGIRDATAYGSAPRTQLDRAEIVAFLAQQ